MVAHTELPTVRRPIQLAAFAGTAFAVALLACRAFENPGDPATALRVLVGALAIGAVVLTRRRSFVQRAALFAAVEVVGGLVTFAYVDVPFVSEHRAQIGALAVTIYDDVNRSR